MVVIGPYCELSVIITFLIRKSVVCLYKHAQWLCRLYVLILFYYFLLFVAFKEKRTYPYNQQHLGSDEVEYIEASAGSM